MNTTQMLSRTASRVARSLTRAASSQAASSSSSASAVPAARIPTEATPAPVSQSPNYPSTWSTSQRSRGEIYKTVRFEQTDLEFQPNPVSAMELIAREPVRLVHGRKAVCDGGIGPLGHPKVFINLDKPGPKACGYCGIRFEQAPHHGHEH